MWLLCSAAPWIVYDVLVIGYIYLYANGNIKKISFWWSVFVLENLDNQILSIYHTFIYLQ